MADDDICKTGITNLDQILDGGIPRGDSVILAGSSGTGKTILSLEILFRGAEEFKERGVYLSFTEPRAKIIKHIKNFKFYNKDLIESGVVRIIDSGVTPKLLRSPSSMSPDGLSRLIYEIVQETKTKRMVIDSITSLCQHLKDDSEIRKFLFKLGYKMMDMNCTTFLISEVPPDKFQYSAFGVEEFIADGIIFLREFERDYDLVRTLQVVKMRGVSHSRIRYGMAITAEGIYLTNMLGKSQSNR